MLEVKNLNKQFNGNQILNHLSFEVKEHSIYGFIGKNGAGKTTTMNLILGLIKADSGEIFVNQEPVLYGGTNTNRWIGYLPDVPEFYGFMSAYEYMDLCAKITGLQEKDTKKRIQKLLSQVGLVDDKKKISGYSRGMKQRLGIAQALLNEPKLFICDEPTSALDPEGRKEVLDIMESVKENTTILFSTHILSDVERICDHVGFLNHGKMQLSGTLEDIQKQLPQKGFEIEFLKQEEKRLFERLFQEEKVKIYEKEKLRTKESINEKEMLFIKENISIKETIDTNDKTNDKNPLDMQLAISICEREHLTPLRLEQKRADLEDLFLEVIKE